MRCAYIKANGQRCGANAIKGAELCFTHNPRTRKKHALAVTRGGKASHRDRLNLEPVKAQSPQDVISLLENTINGIRTGQIPPNVANTIGYLCGHLLKAIEASDLDKRLEVIERVILERKAVMKGVRR
ncbi:hypothetical protein ACFLZP_02495 [Patescibacteria group bacterium]